MSGAALRALLEERAREGPERPALRLVAHRGVERVVSWSELVVASKAVGRALSARSDVVLLSAPNGPDLVSVLLGALIAARSVLLAPPELPAAPLRRIATAARAALFIGGAGDRRAREPGLPPFVAIESLLAGPAGAQRAREGSLCLPTSGTTGRQKIARRSVRALIAVGEACARGIGISADDRVLLAIPLCHSYGIDQLMTALVSGCAVDLHTAFHPARVLRALRDDGITCLPAVPVMLDGLARSVQRAPAPRLRRVISAGSPLPLAVFERFQAALGFAIGQLYGATEFGSVTYNAPERSGFDPLAVGVPLPGVEIRVLDAVAPEPDAPLACGAKGLVAVAAPSLLDGYLGEDVRPAPSRFFVTGDLGALDERGVLRLEGRCDLLVDVGGRKVNPLEVEVVLADHPGVREVAVFAVPGSDTVSRLRAVIVPEPGAELDDAALRVFARTHLPPHMVPRYFELRSELPRSPAGKLLRSELAEEGAS